MGVVVNRAWASTKPELVAGKPSLRSPVAIEVELVLVEATSQLVELEVGLAGVWPRVLVEKLSLNTVV
jgi:hypothetical protein